MTEQQFAKYGYILVGFCFGCAFMGFAVTILVALGVRP